MSPEYRGAYAGQGLHFAVVVSRFNELVTSRLLAGARDALVSHGVQERDIDVVWTPGAFEIPLIAKRLAETGRYAAIVCLGAVIRGETPHFEYVASAAVNGIGRASLESNVPMAMGVLTTNDVTQALERAGSKAGNKGFEAAMTALEMASVLRDIGGR
ncbi:MAG: 6,7-dimethyl-8-ribityllumazine synthase [Dehalococcoidia bacterium]